MSELCPVFSCYLMHVNGFLKYEIMFIALYSLRNEFPNLGGNHRVREINMKCLTPNNILDLFVGLAK